jgi:hypothetical protein
VTEREDGTVVELPPREPAIVARLDDYRPEPDEVDGEDDPPQAA